MAKSKQPNNDSELDEYLAGDSPLSQLYAEQSSENTTPGLDQIIISAASRKTGPVKGSKKKKATPTPARRSPRWMKPLAAVATIVLGLGLTLDLLQDQTIVPDKTQATPGTPQATQAPVARTDTSEKIQSGDKPSAFADEAPVEKTQKKPLRSAPKPEAIAPGSVDEESQEVSPEPAQAARRSSPEAVAPKAKPAETNTAGQDSAGTETQTQSEPETAAQSKTESKPQNFDEPVAPPADSYRRLPPAAESGSQAQPALPDDNVNPAPAEPEYRDSPQTWIRHIVFLADTGQSALAVSELEAFRARHPNGRIPAELEDLQSR